MRALIAVAMLGTSASADPVIEGRAGPPALSDPTVRPMTADAFLSSQAKLGADAVPVRRLPDGQTSAWYGELRLDGKLVGWTVRGDAERGYALIVDTNADGDLSDDVEVPFASSAGGFEARTGAAWMQILGGSLHDQVVRRGIVDVGDTQVPFELVQRGDDFVVWSIDGNPVASASRVRVGAHDYDIAVARGGDAIQLRRWSDDRASVPEVAPDIETSLIDGSAFSLRAHRGEVVVLDFWESWCSPCRASRADVERLAKKVTVLSINSNDDITEQPEASRWAHTTEAYQRNQHRTFTPIFDRYEVTRVPSFVVIDADGQIVRAHCSLQEVEHLLERSPETARPSAVTLGP
jgi:thiol-disulfide isomerase/thioredoxin